MVKAFVRGKAYRYIGPPENLDLPPGTTLFAFPTGGPYSLHADLRIGTPKGPKVEHEPCWCGHGDWFELADWFQAPLDK